MTQLKRVTTHARTIVAVSGRGWARIAGAVRGGAAQAKKSPLKQRAEDYFLGGE
jgi:hypothetical protein